MNFNSCIRNLLKLIYVLQDNSTNISSCEPSCTKAFLGPMPNRDCYNTRVITLYNKFGNLLSTSFLDGGALKESSKFRIHSLNGDCCTLLILDEVGDRFISTKQYITVRISCICAVKCIKDVNVKNL